MDQRRRAVLSLVVIGVVVGVLSWIPVAGGHVSGWERAVFRSVNDLPRWLYRPVWVPMQFGSAIAIAVVALAVLAWRRTRLAVTFALAGTLARLLSSGFKVIVDRARPPILLSGVHVRGPLLDNNGYPSGHASVAFALATVAWLCLDGWTRWILPVVAVMVAFARVYVGAHMPLDVVGGAAVGTVCGAAVTWAVKRDRSPAR